MRWARRLLLVAAAGYLLTGLHQIRPEERAVVKRFGRVTARPGPGLWIGLPWGIDRVERIPIAQIQRVTVGFPLELEEEARGVPAGLLLTGDESLVNLRLHVDFAVAEGDAALDDYILHRAEAEAIIARETESALVEWASGREFKELLLTGSGDLPGWIAPRVQARIEPLHLGVRIQSVSVALLAAPDEVRGDFERLNQAEPVNRTRVHQAEQEKLQRIQEAENNAYRLRQEARAYAEGRRALAEADVEAFRKRLQQYHRLRDVHPDILGLIWWDEMSRLLLGMKDRGRVDLLDHYLGPDGLDIQQIVPSGRRK